MPLRGTTGLVNGEMYKAALLRVHTSSAGAVRPRQHTGSTAGPLHSRRQRVLP
jgi:hypothetical protein